ncbi:MAG: hypothetical protein LBL21_03995, partial [Rickettsiales bacterium]|nr:hypothetical protein [Rickettsiales bacterium]
MFARDNARMTLQIERAFGAKIDALPLSDEDKRDIRDNILKIVDISRKYISGVEQRLLHPANYNPQNAESMR